jgi:hypothetical protein
MWQQLFGLTNAGALVAWGLLILGPRRWSGVLLPAGVGLLCAVYVALAVGLASGALDPVRVPGAPPPALSDYSVRGLRALFASDGGIVVGWTHYLALDLFTGLWIAREADARGWSRVAQAPVLLLTFLAGPLGLLLFLLLRPIGSGRVMGQADGRQR